MINGVRLGVVRKEVEEPNEGEKILEERIAAKPDFVYVGALYFRE